MATKNQSPRKLKNFQGLWSFSEWFSVLFQVGVHGFFQHSAYGVTVFGNHLFGVGGIVSVDLAAQTLAQEYVDKNHCAMKLLSVHEKTSKGGC